MARKKIPPHIRQVVLLEAGYKCGNPVCRHVLTLELHHIVWVKDGGENEPSNLLALCPNCHALHTKSHIPASAINTWKSMLVALNSSDHASADLLLLLASEQERISSAENPDDVPPPFRFTGDGLPALAGLITSGLVKVGARFSGGNAWGASMPSFEVELTESGKRLVDAWRAGTSNLKHVLDYDE